LNTIVGIAMKIGDLVRFNNPAMFKKTLGIVTRIDDSHRQSKVDVLFYDTLRKGIWDGYLEVVNESW